MFPYAMSDLPILAKTDCDLCHTYTHYHEISSQEHVTLCIMCCYVELMCIRGKHPQTSV